MDKYHVFYIGSKLKANLSATVQQLVNECGHEIVGTAFSEQEAKSKIQSLGACLDLVLCDISSMNLDGFLMAQKLGEWLDIPIIVITENSFVNKYFSQLDSSKFGYLAKPFTREIMETVLNFNYRRFQDIKIMKQKYDEITHALNERKLVERAKGIIMKMNCCTEEEAMKKLQKRSAQTNIKMTDLAKEIIELGQKLIF